MEARELVAPVAEDILAAAAGAEAERRLPDRLVARLKEQGLFSIYTPREFGGMGFPLPKALRVVEEVARLDGSTGWTVALGIANAYFLSSLPDESAARVFDGGSALIAAAPGPGVRAMAVDGGYRLAGQWAFNSGAANADWVALAAPIFDGDEPRMGVYGPEMVFAVLPPGDVSVVDTWHVTGLRATSSHDLRADDVFVPHHMTGGFSMATGPRAVRESAYTRFPLFTLLGLAQSAPVSLGLARHALDEFRQLALAKERPFGGRLSDQIQAHVGLARAEALLRSARSYWYEVVDSAWDRVAHGCDLSMDERADLRMASLTAVENAVEATGLAYRLAGSTAIFQSMPLERCWRDVHTAAQHMLVQDGRWETVGRILFGLEPASPFI